MNILDKGTTENAPTENVDNAPVADEQNSETTGNDNTVVTDNESETTSNNEETSNWFDNLSDEVKSMEGFDGIKEKIKDVDSLASAYINLQKHLGKKSEADLKIPDADASDEEKAEFFEKIGRPKEAGEYKWDTPEGFEVDSEVLTERNAKLHELGITQDQYQGIMDIYAEEVDRINGNWLQDEKQVISESEQALKEEWGNDYQKNIDGVAKMAEKFGLKDTLMETGLINHLPVLQMLHKVRLSTTEDGIVKTPDSGYSREDEIKQIRNSKAFLDRGHPDHDKVMKKLVSLYN